MDHLEKLIHLFYDHPLDETEMSLFINRVRALGLMDEAVEGAKNGQIENFAILGEEGMGKSSLITVAHSKAKAAGNILPIKLEITAETTEYLFLKDMCNQIANSIRLGLTDKIKYLISSGESGEKLLKEVDEAVCGVTKTEGSSREFSVALLNLINFSIGKEKGEMYAPPEDVIQIMNTLNSLTPLLRMKYATIIVFIDEAGYVATEKSVSLIQRMRLFFQKRPFMVVVAGNSRLIEELTTVVPEAANMFPEGNRAALPPLVEADVGRLIASRIVKGENPFLDAEVLYQIYRESEGNPRYVVRICRTVLRILKEEGVDEVDVGTVVRASSKILAVKGQDLFSKLSPAVKELTVQLYREGGSSYSSLLARKMEKTQGRISQMLVELRDLGYVKDERKKNKMIYTLCRALHRYLEQTFGGAETFKNQHEDETISGGKRD